ncbi:MAG TPA: hypothetical protein PK788_14425 [Gemmatimonadaceae bacterium]|nr:hypothetical protein [Gemmatimonadaceae bacterium]
MPRALTIHRIVVPPADRAKFFERLREKERHYTAMGCRYWVFEEQQLPGAFVEFCEADSAQALSAAHAAAPETPRDPTRIYTQLELS